VIHPQLQAVVDDFERAHDRLRQLARSVPEASWRPRADPARWSVGECVSHLNLTSAAFVPVLRNGLARARQLGGPPPRRYRRGPIGWLLWRGAGPPVRVRVKTTAPFVPRGDASAESLVDEFARLQAEQIACARDADGLPLGRVRIASPFDRRVKYNLFACLTILPRHQHRHLWQAERVWEALR